MATEGFRAGAGEALPRAPLRAVALHRGDVGQILLHAIGGGGAGGAAGLARPSGEAGHRRGEQKRHRHGGRGQPHQLRNHLAIAVVDERHGHQSAHHGDGRHQREIEADALDGRRVVHGAVHAVADALIVQHRHRQPHQPPEQLRAQAVGHALHQADVAQEVRQAPHAARQGPASADHVLGLRGGILPLGHERGVATGLAHAGAEHHHQRSERGQRRQQHAGGIEAGDGVHERRHEGRERHVRVRQGPLDHHVIDQDLERPRRYQERRETAHHQQKLQPEQPAVGPDVGQRAPKDAQHRAGAERGIDVDAVVVARRAPRYRPRLDSLARHRHAATASAATKRRYRPSGRAISSAWLPCSTMAPSFRNRI